MDSAIHAEGKRRFRLGHDGFTFDLLDCPFAVQQARWITAAAGKFSLSMSHRHGLGEVMPLMVCDCRVLPSRTGQI